MDRVIIVSVYPSESVSQILVVESDRVYQSLIGMW